MVSMPAGEQNTVVSTGTNILGTSAITSKSLNRLSITVAIGNCARSRLGYDFTKYIPAKWPVKGVKLDFVANNVLIIKKWVDNIDPESVGYGTDAMVGLESPGFQQPEE